MWVEKTQVRSGESRGTWLTADNRQQFTWLMGNRLRQKYYFCLHRSIAKNATELSVNISWNIYQI